MINWERINSEKEACSFYLSYRKIILSNSFRFWFKKLFVTRLWPPITRQPSTADTGWRVCCKKQKSGNKTVSQIFKKLFSSAVMSKYDFLREFWPNWTFKCYKKRFKKNIEKLRHLFVKQTMTISKIFYSKKSDIRMSRYGALSWNGHFLGKLVNLSPWKLLYKKKKHVQIVRVLSVFVTVSTFTSNEHKHFKKHKREVALISGATLNIHFPKKHSPVLIY